MPSLKYSIDTSGLTYGWRDHYPQDVFPIVWEHMSDAIDSGDLVASEEVYEELRVGGDDLFDWVHDRRQMFVPLDGQIQQAVSNILAAHPQWIPADRSRNMCDPFVIAVAQVMNCTVVSAELWYPNAAARPDRIRIPNVCSSFGVRHITFLEMMREQGWVFTRR